MNNFGLIICFASLWLLQGTSAKFRFLPKLNIFGKSQDMIDDVDDQETDYEALVDDYSDSQFIQTSMNNINYMEKADSGARQRHESIPSPSLENEGYTDFAPLQVMCEINGFVVPAIIDTGAQISIMSFSCAQRCRINSNIDTRYSGKAIGVGSSDIIGRIKSLPMRVGPVSFDGTISILRDSRVDFLIGLDFLKRFNCEISFSENMLKLKIQDRSIRVPLLNERHDNGLFNTINKRNVEIPQSQIYRNEWEEEDIYGENERYYHEEEQYVCYNEDSSSSFRGSTKAPSLESNVSPSQDMKNHGRNTLNEEYYSSSSSSNEHDHEGYYHHDMDEDSSYESSSSLNMDSVHRGMDVQSDMKSDEHVWEISASKEEVPSFSLEGV